MIMRFTLPNLLASSIIVGLVLGYLFEPLIPYFPVPVQQQNSSESQVPVTINPTPPNELYITHEGVCKISLAFFPTSLPKLLSIEYLDQGRIVDYPPGNYRITLYNEENQIIFEQSFQVLFLSGEPLTLKDQMKLVFIVPYDECGTKLIVDTPIGTVSYELPERR